MGSMGEWRQSLAALLTAYALRYVIEQVTRVASGEQAHTSARRPLPGVQRSNTEGGTLVVLEEGGRDAEQRSEAPAVARAASRREECYHDYTRARVSRG